VAVVAVLHCGWPKVQLQYSERDRH
jgi:hypothetical protein